MGRDALATDSAGNALIATCRLGGHVFFTSDASLGGTRRTLDAFLAMCGAFRSDVSQAAQPRHL